MLHEEAFSFSQAWQEGDAVRFRMRFDGSVLHVEWMLNTDNEGAFQRRLARPTIVTAFVEGGNACFADFVVTGG